MTGVIRDDDDMGGFSRRRSSAATDRADDSSRVFSTVSWRTSRIKAVSTLLTEPRIVQPIDAENSLVALGMLTFLRYSPCPKKANRLTSPHRETGVRNSALYGCDFKASIHVLLLLSKITFDDAMCDLPQNLAVPL